MSDENVIDEPAPIAYSIRLANVVDVDGNANEVTIEVAQLETMGMPFDLTCADAVYVMACMYAVDVMGFEDASQATMIDMIWN